MAFTNSTSHFGLPQYIGTDRPKYLTDVNNAYKKIDDEIYNAQTEAKAADASAEQANTNANSALTNANAAVEVANLANETAKTAQETATTAENTANRASQTATQAETTAGNAVAVANNANTLAGEAQASANKAVADSTTAVKVGGNIANAYDASKKYVVGDYCLYNGILYKCITAVNAEAFNVDKWDDVTVGEELLNIGGTDLSEITQKVTKNTNDIAKHETELNGLYFAQNTSGEWGYKTSASGDVVPFKKAAGATGNAVASEVLSGRTFSNASAIGLTGTMANNGSKTVQITPKSTAQSQSLDKGYYDGITINVLEVTITRETTRWSPASTSLTITHNGFIEVIHDTGGFTITKDGITYESTQIYSAENLFRTELIPVKAGDVLTSTGASSLYVENFEVD